MVGNSANNQSGMSPTQTLLRKRRARSAGGGSQEQCVGARTASSEESKGAKTKNKTQGGEAFAQGGNVALNSPVFHVLSRPNGASLEAGATQTRDC